MYKNTIENSEIPSKSVVEKAVLAHLQELYRTALALCGNRVLAEDLVHDSCVKILSVLKKGKHEDLLNARAWFHKILLNTFRDHYRRELRSPFSELPEQFANVIEFLPGAESTPEDKLEFKQFEKAVRNAISSLPPDIQNVLILKLVSDLSYKDIAAAVESPIGTVMSRLSRGRAMLREELSVYFVEDQSEIDIVRQGRHS